MVPQRTEKLSELSTLFARKTAEHLVHLFVVNRKDGLDERSTRIGEPHAGDPPIVGIGPSFDDAVALGSIDEAGHIARRHEERTRQRRKRLPVMAMKTREEIEASHRHTPPWG